MSAKLFHIYRDKILIARTYSQAARDAVIRLLAEKGTEDL